MELVLKEDIMKILTLYLIYMKIYFVTLIILTAFLFTGCNVHDENYASDDPVIGDDSPTNPTPGTDPDTNGYYIDVTDTGYCLICK